MSSPRAYGGGYAAPSFSDTPIYDRLVAERGTPQIGPINMSMPGFQPGYQPGLQGGYQSGYQSGGLPALPAAGYTAPPPHYNNQRALPAALPAAPMQPQQPMPAPMMPRNPSVPYQQAPQQPVHPMQPQQPMPPQMPYQGQQYTNGFGY
jgi:hypothetical protein